MRSGRVRWEGGFVVRRSKLFGEDNVGRDVRPSRIARGSAGSGRGQGKQALWAAVGVKRSRLRLDMRGLGGIGRTRQVQVAVPATMRSGRRCAYDTAAQRQRRAIAVGRGVRIRTASGVERDGQAGEGYCWMDRMVQLSTTSSGRSRRAPAAAATSSEALTALEDRRKPPASNRRR